MYNIYRSETIQDPLTKTLAQILADGQDNDSTLAPAIFNSILIEITTSSCAIVLSISAYAFSPPNSGQDARPCQSPKILQVFRMKRK